MFISETRCQSTCHWWRRERPFDYSCGSSQCWYSDLVSVFFLLDYFSDNVVLVQGLNIVSCIGMNYKLGYLMCAMYLSNHIKRIKHFTCISLFGSHNNPMKKILASFYKNATPEIIWETDSVWSWDLKLRILALKTHVLSHFFILAWPVGTENPWLLENGFFNSPCSTRAGGGLAQ